MKKHRVLVIEDNKSQSELLELAINTLNKKSTTFNLVISNVASNVFEAASLFDPDRYDLIITDERMPYVSGSVFIKYLRDSGVNTPVIFASGVGNEELKKVAREGMAVAVFKKPYSINDLNMIVVDILGLS